MLERNATSAPARRTRRRDVVARSPSASGSEDVVQKGPPGSHWPRSALRADRPTPKATRMVQKNFCSTICTHRLDSGSFIDAMLSRLLGEESVKQGPNRGRESMPHNHTLHSVSGSKPIV